MDKKCRLNFELFTLSRENEKKEIYFGKKQPSVATKCNKRKNKKLFSFFVAYLRVCRFEKDQPEIKNEIRFWRGWGEEKIFHHGSLNLNGQKYPKKYLESKSII